MKWDNLTGNLIDTQPAFSVMQTLDSQHTDDATRAFAAHKLRQCIRSLRDTASFLEKELKARKLDK